MNKKPKAIEINLQEMKHRPSPNRRRGRSPKATAAKEKTMKRDLRSGEESSSKLQHQKRETLTSLQTSAATKLYDEARIRDWEQQNQITKFKAGEPSSVLERSNSTD